mmetsp:Transcript_7675/g.19574  ORF Transcript_7675/g.19574 Transcript_7675/m.19574 type:complete len:326 (+) Transcript_7675:494-1471(+)
MAAAPPAAALARAVGARERAMRLSAALSAGIANASTCSATAPIACMPDVAHARMPAPPRPTGRYTEAGAEREMASKGSGTRCAAPCAAWGECARVLCSRDTPVPVRPARHPEAKAVAVAVGEAHWGAPPRREALWCSNAWAEGAGCGGAAQGSSGAVACRCSCRGAQRWLDAPSPLALMLSAACAPTAAAAAAPPSPPAPPAGGGRHRSASSCGAAVGAPRLDDSGWKGGAGGDSLVACPAALAGSSVHADAGGRETSSSRSIFRSAGGGDGRSWGARSSAGGFAPCTCRIIDRPPPPPLPSRTAARDSSGARLVELSPSVVWLR